MVTFLSIFAEIATFESSLVPATIEFRRLRLADSASPEDEAAVLLNEPVKSDLQSSLDSREFIKLSDLLQLILSVPPRRDGRMYDSRNSSLSAAEETLEHCRLKRRAAVSAEMLGSETTKIVGRGF
jgi:hypothetical protein